MATPLPEIGVARNRGHYACWGADKLAFPPACPNCGGLLVEGTERTAVYDCGASYRPKPQGQTHTEVWWGSCPLPAPPADMLAIVPEGEG